MATLKEFPQDFLDELSEFPIDELPGIAVPMDDIIGEMPDGFSDGQVSDDSPPSKIRDRMDKIRGKMVFRDNVDWQNGRN